MRYAAYGLELDSSFRLPGMTPRQPGRRRARLAVDLVSRERIDSTWCADSAELEWVGVLGDGCELRVECGVNGDRLFGYGDCARFHLDAGRRVLLCSPARAGRELQWGRVLISKVVPSVSTMCGYEALHAAAVATDDGAMAIAAPSGAGKTTLALELMRRGHPLLSDDVVPLSYDDDTVWAHPGSPHMNLDAGDPRATAAVADGVVDELAMLAGERWVSSRSLAVRRRPLTAICLLERAAHLTLAAEQLDASPLPFAPYMLGIGADTERRRRRFRLYAALAAGATIVRLTCGPRDEPGAIADLLAQAIRSATAPVAVAC